MNGIIKAATKLNGFRILTNPLISNTLSTSSKRQITRNIWHMSTSRQDDKITQKVIVPKFPSTLCGCGCGINGIHTKGERELVEFLTEEIVAERKAQKSKDLPKELEGFKVTFDHSEVSLQKVNGDETINIYFNVNHTVDSAPEAEIDPNMDKPEFTEMKSTPNFEVELVRGKSTLAFTCSFLNEVSSGDRGTGENFNDIYGIDEVTFYNGEWEDKNYAVAGDVLDGYLYDLFMNLLEEKGVGNEFAGKLSDLSTTYEHSLYIGLLEKVSTFTSGK